MKVSIKYWEHEKNDDWNLITDMMCFIEENMRLEMDMAFTESINENYPTLEIYGESISPSQTFAGCRPDEYIEARTQWKIDTYNDLWEDLTNEGYASIGDDIYMEVIE